MINEYIRKLNAKTDKCEYCQNTFHSNQKEIKWCSAKCHILSKTIKQEGGCWLWQGYTSKDGYGIIGYKGKSFLVHRLMYIEHYGNISDSEDTRHICDIRNCVNPDHLLKGNRKDNMQDASKRNRIVSSKTRKRYSNDFKKQVVKKYKNISSLKKTASIFGIDYTIISKWANDLRYC